MPTIDVTATGQNIQAMCKTAGITAKHIQNACGLTTANAVYKWIHGVCMPTIDNMVIIADILGTTIDHLIVINRQT